MNSTAVILAAGKGTRMHSDKPKVLQPVLGDPMLRHVREALRPVFGDRVFIVVGHRVDMVEATFAGERFVHQAEQLGTGHALMQALPGLRADACEMVLVVNGDTPLLRAETVAHFMKEAEGAELAFAIISLDDPGTYGRVVRDDEGHVSAIVEAKDYDLSRYGAPTGEVNAGMYAIRLSLAETLLPRLSNTNRSGEYYITDLVGLAVAEGRDVRGVQCGSDESLMGVNSPRELARAEENLRAFVVEGLLDKGVLLHAPALVRVSPRATIEAGAELCGPCDILGSCHVERGARIEAYCSLRDSHVASGAEIRPYCHLEQARVGEGALVGPYARLRPGAVLERDSHVGNFVELKKARLGVGSKANHLTYLGDAEIGAGVNIGAGTITCNYDGRNKHRTTIEDGAFIGSNTALVAPVTVGKECLVGAGSVITHDVPAGELAVARGKQKNLPRRK